MTTEPEAPLSDVDKIWKDDLLKRKDEASALIGYIESVAGRPRLSDGEHAHVLAVDAGYGEGKTFFLKKLGEQLKLSHPVAYVDAWKDDLEDQPLTAIAATLEDALKDYTAQAPAVAKAMEKLRGKAGAVLKIAAGGAVRRLIGLAITQVAADELAEIVTDVVKEDFANEAAKKFSDDLVDADTKGEKSGAAVMAQRIATFRAGQDAIDGLRQSLEDVVEALKETDAEPPIVIIIDELDRCRPTYAIKLLEEVKHLFDAKGVVFIFGMHADQLQHSVAKAYGASFGAADYLRRFIHRRYSLKPATLADLVEKAFRDLDIDVSRLRWHSYSHVGSSAHVDAPPPRFAVGAYLDEFGVPARDAYRAVEMLQICLGLAKPYNLLLELLMPMICGSVMRKGSGIPAGKAKWQVHVRNRRNNEIISTGLNPFANELQNFANRGDQSWNVEASYGSVAAQVLITEAGNIPTASIAHPKNYAQLIETLARFDIAAPRSVRDEGRPDPFSGASPA